MKKRIASLMVAGALGSALLVPAAVQAQPLHPCYLHGIGTPEEMWMCVCGEVGDALSPVIPPDSWECGYPDIPPGGGI